MLPRVPPPPRVARRLCECRRCAALACVRAPPGAYESRRYACRPSPASVSPVKRRAEAVASAPAADSAP